MRLRIKFKILQQNPKKLSININNESIKINQNKEISISETTEEENFDSFLSLLNHIQTRNYKIDINDMNKIQNQLKIYQDKSRKIIFPIEIKDIKYIYEIKALLNNYLNSSYYDFNLLKNLISNEKDNKIFHFEIQVVNLEIEHYVLWEGFKIKDTLKDYDKLK